MTQFKEGDEVLLKMKVSEHASKPQMIWATVSKEGSEGIFLINEYDLIPASALDVNKELLAENERLRNNQSILITSFRINMMRLRPDYSQEEFDKDIAAMLKEKE